MDNYKTHTNFMGPLGTPLMDNISSEDRCYRDLIAVSQIDSIKEFNEMVDHTIPSILMGVHDISDTQLIEVVGVEVKFPFFYVDNKGSGGKSKRLLTPYLAILTGQSYMCQVVVNLFKEDKHTGVRVFESNRAIGSIECMVGSNRCITSVKPPEIETLEKWKMMLREDPTIPGGYFIKDGAKKIILYGERLSINTHISVESKSDKRVVTRITDLHDSKTTVVILQNAKKTPSIKVMTAHLKGKHYPLFLVLYLLSNQAKVAGTSQNFNVDAWIDIISNFSPPGEKEHVAAFLDASKQVFLRRFCIFTAEGIIYDHEYITTYINNKISDKKNLLDIHTVDGISRTLYLEIAPSLNTATEKMMNLCLMTSQHIRCSLGLREFNSRDRWDIKQLGTGVRRIEQNVADILLNRLKTSGTDDKVFNVGKGGNENILEAFKCDSTALMLSYLSKIVANVDSQSKNYDVRKVQPTAMFLICPAKTAEGKLCGIDKRFAICTHISKNNEYYKDRLQSIFAIARYRMFSFNTVTDQCRFRLTISDDQRKFLINDAYVSENFLDFLFGSLPGLPYEVLEGNEIEIKIARLDDVSTTIPTCYGMQIEVPFGEQNEELLSFFRNIFLIINEYVSLKRFGPYSHSFLYNGNVLLDDPDGISLRHKMYSYSLWVNPSNTIKFLKNERRHLRLPMDCSIVENEVNKTVEYSDDSGRVLVPMLVADLDDKYGELLVDKDKEFFERNWPKGETNDYRESERKINEMFQLGYMEYIGAKELGNSFIAATIHEFRNFVFLRKFLDSLDWKTIDSFATPIAERPGRYFSDDTSFIKVNGKIYDVEFMETQSDSVSITANIQGMGVKTLYGIVLIKYTKYVLEQQQYLELTVPNGVQRRDGFYLGCFDRDQFKWVPENSLEFSDTEFEGNKLVPVKFPRGQDHIVMLVETKGDRKLLKPYNGKFFENTGKEWFYKEDDTIHWVDNLELDGKDYYRVEFSGHQNGYFSETTDTVDVKLEEEMDYDKFDFDAERESYDQIIRENEDHHRESDFLIAPVREHQEIIEFIKSIEDPYVQLIKFQEFYHDLRKKSNLYKVYRYLMWSHRFTHVPINPNIAYSSVANLVPKPECNQGPRYTYQCAMGTQAKGLVSPIYFTWFATSMKRSLQPEQHLFETVAEEPLCCVTMPTRVNKILAVMSTQEGFEDAIVVAFSMRYEKSVTIIVRETIDNTHSERIGIPTDGEGNQKTGNLYRHLDENGLPRIGSIIAPGDCIVGMVRREIKDSRDVTERNVSKMAQIGDDGEVIQIHISATESSKKERIIRIKIAQRRFTRAGDKFAAPFSQKGTEADEYGLKDTYGEHLKEPGYDLSGEFMQEDLNALLDEGKLKYRVVDDHEMPRVIGGPNDGMMVHILFSPHSFPSRMTMGMVFMMLASKAALRVQMKMNATAFEKLDLKYFETILTEHGLDRFGDEFLCHADGEKMMDSVTGKQMKVFTCPLSYQALKHDVMDKYSVRSTGILDPTTLQPVKGRKRGGAQKFGEMEKDAIVSHGAPEILDDRFNSNSDNHENIVCQNCKNLTSESDLLEGVCRICQAQDSFAVVNLPRVCSNIFNSLNGIGMNFELELEDPK